MTTTEWRTVPIRDLCLGIFDGPHATPKKTASGPVFLGISSLDGGRLNFEESAHLSEVDFAKWTRRVTPQPNDVVFSYETRLGEAAIIPEGLRCCLGRRMALMRPDPSMVDPRFLLYAYLGPEFQETIRQRTIHGSTVERILLTEVPDFPMSVPDLATQRSIAALLGALDDKIELNRRMNRTLESIARAIFKSWLVDFDPVRRKVEGGDVGLPLDIAALFPETMETTTTGVVPSGWRLGVCADSFTVTMGQSPPGDTYNEDGVGLPFYQGRRDFGERFPTRRVFCSAPSRLARRGDTLVSVRAPVGDINIAIEKCCIGRGLAAVRHQSGAIMYTYEAMRAFQPQFEDFEAGGTVFGSIGGSDFRHLPMVIPPLDVVQAYEDAAHATGVALVSTHRESHYLTLLRDSLLPALMNGEMSSAAHAFADRTLEVQT